VTLPYAAAQATLLDASGAIDALAHRRDGLQREIVAMVPGSPWAVQVGRLRCLRGIDTLSAVGLCAEIGDFERFAHAEQLMSYLGLVPCESTTGQQRRLGSITKTGSGHARRLLVEAAWHYRKRPAVGKALAERQDAQPAEAVAIAWSAQRRLHRTWTRARAAREAPHDHRRRRRPRALGVLLGDHPDRVRTAASTAHIIPSAGSVAARHRAGNPR
jgi:transposase